METSPPRDFSEQIDERVESLRREASDAGRSYDYPGLAAELQMALEARDISTFDPPDATYWRTVLAALKRRAGLPV